MVKRFVLGCFLFLGWANGVMALQVTPNDSLVQTESALVDTAKVVGDSALLVQGDSGTVQKVADSTAIALRAMAGVDVDSTKLVLDQVRVLTEKISDQALLNAHLVKEVFSDTAVVNKYNRLLDRMVAQYASEVERISANDTAHVNPLYFRLFAPLTLYKSPITKAVSADTCSAVTLEDSLRLASMASGRDLLLLNELDRVLLSVYLTSPTLVGLTEDELKASKNLSEETKKKASETAKIDVATAVVAPLVEARPQAVTEMVVRKPNFWVTKGSFSTQMTESYFSPNWYQGGVNNLNMLSMLTLEANYNNKRKIQWDNKLDARLGFYQNQAVDTEKGREKFQSNQDLLRLTSKLNLKAIRNWNYTVEAQGNTQMLDHFENDEKTLKSRFLAPADASLTIGMDFKKSFKNGSISIYPGPLSYKMTYVAVEELGKNYGLEDGKKMRSDLGSKIEVNFDYKITQNISYKTRFYYFTAPDKVSQEGWYKQMDWENTLNFQVSKYISTKLFFHTRFDDLKDPDPNWNLFQFKQYLMLALNYAW